jgi:hypothetical protein
MPLDDESSIAKPSGDIPIGGFTMKLDDYALDRGKPWCRRPENVIFGSFDIELENIDSPRRRLPKYFIHGRDLKLTTP